MEKPSRFRIPPPLTDFSLQVINTMMDQLQIFSSEVSRVAREVGTEGILGGQAQIVGVDGTWKELTNNGKNLFHFRHDCQLAAVRLVFDLKTNYL